MIRKVSIGLAVFMLFVVSGGSSAQSTEIKPEFSWTWKDGKTTVESKSLKIDLTNTLQVRFAQELPEKGTDVSSFRLRRAKMRMEGWVYTKDLSYELQLNFADTATILDDANVNYDLTHGRRAFMLKAGQFKPGLGRQELTSDNHQEFVDRSIVSTEFARSRDIGAQVWGAPLGGRLDWRLGAFNGNGRTTTRNDNDKLQWNARVTWQPIGKVTGYAEGDVDGSDQAQLAVAAQYESNERPVAATSSTPADRADRTIVGGDVMFKYQGFSFVGELFDATTHRRIAADFDSDGYSVQAGYFFVPHRFEVALRQAKLEPNADQSGDLREERGVSLNWFFNKHPHKIQADFRQIENQATRSTDDEIRVQYQLNF